METPTQEPLYDIVEWAAATTIGRRIFNYNYHITGTEFRGWDLVNTADMGSESELIERIYILEKKGSEGNQLIRISIAETNEWRRAQSQLQTQLAYSMCPNIPRGEIGDVGFTARSENSNIVASILFTRGNVAVSVSSVGTQTVDVSTLARTLDHTLGEPPTEKDLEEKRVIDRSYALIEAKELESTAVIDRLPARTIRNGWIKVIVPDGEIARDGDSLVYIPSMSGSKQVQEFVVVQNDRGDSDNSPDGGFEPKGRPSPAGTC